MCRSGTLAITLEPGARASAVEKRPTILTILRFNWNGPGDFYREGMSASASNKSTIT